MHIEQIRGMLYKKLHRELRGYTEKALRNTKLDIIAQCFEINLYIVIYEVLLEVIEKLEYETLKTMIRRENILENLYESYTDLYGDDYERVKAFVKEVIE